MLRCSHIALLIIASVASSLWLSCVTTSFSSTADHLAAKVPLAGFLQSMQAVKYVHVASYALLQGYTASSW